jgi:hypothetical protein
MKIELTEQQLKNLQAFLQRVDLKGAEVPAYVEIMNMLNNPDKSEDNVED